MTGSEELLAAFLGGMLPALVWLFFWLRTDHCEPEPKYRIMLTFVAGAVAVGIALPIERGVAAYIGPGIGVGVLIVWAATEELLKFGAAYVFGLSSRAYNEPIDAVVYLVTAALGFSAVENAMYLWTPLHEALFMQGLMTGDMRFIGATLLHTLTSATIGLCLAYTFFSSRARKWLAVSGGVILAIVLHTLFNFFILKEANGETGFAIFLAIWVGIIILLYFLERVKDPVRDYC